MSGLTFGEEGDTDGDNFVMVGIYKAIKEGATEALDGRCGPGKPYFGDAKNLAIAALGWRWWREREGRKGQEE